MEVNRNYLILTAVALLLTLATGHEYKELYLEQLCDNGTFQVSNETGPDSSWLVRSNKDGNHTPDLNCSLCFVVPNNFELIVTIRQLNYSIENGTCNDRLEIEDKNGNTTELFGLDPYDNAAFNPVCLYYVTCPEAPGNCSTSDFELVFTVSQKGSADGKCGDDQEFLCDTNKCVWNGLRCDKIYNCGDHSDERGCAKPPPDVSKGDSTGIIVGVVFAVIFLIVVVSLIIYRRRRYSPYRQP